MTSDIVMLKIRPVEERDLEPLAREIGFSRRHIEGRWLERLAGERTMLVAELDGQAAGSVSFEERDSFGELLHLFALAVTPAAQRQGIGMRLIESVEAEAQQRRLAGVYLGVAIDNLDALRLYERLEYRRTGEPYTSRWTWFGQNGEAREIVERCYRMIKRLG